MDISLSAEGTTLYVKNYHTLSTERLSVRLLKRAVTFRLCMTVNVTLFFQRFYLLPNPLFESVNEIRLSVFPFVNVCFFSMFKNTKDCQTL